jgi:diacylglycerol kinase family enzyme
VDLAEIAVDGQKELPFINTASIGGYPDSVRIRDRLEGRLGKWPAAGIAMMRVLRAAAPLEVVIDGERTAVWMLFVGNGRYWPPDQIPMQRHSIDETLLDIRYLRADTKASRSRLLFGFATGTLERRRSYVRRLAPQLSVQVLGSPIALAADGEVVGEGVRFEFRSRPGALALYS